MLSIALILPFLFVGCLTVGASVGSFDRLTAFLRVEERLALFFWLGLTLLAIFAETVSLFGPVHLTHFILAVGISGAVVFARSATRRQLVQVARAMSMKQFSMWGAAIVIAIAGVAAVHSVRTIYFDTRHYHYQAVQWFSTFGAVKGLALMHVRLGFGSAWLPFLAMFDVGPSPGRFVSLGAALILLGSLIFWSVAAWRCFTQRGTRSDHFLAFIVPALVAQPWVGWQFNSASPDLAAAFIGASLVWLMIAICDRWRDWKGMRARPLVSDGVSILALGCGVGSMKLSAMVFPVVVTGFFLVAFRMSRSRLVACPIVWVALLGPLFIFGLRTSGFPLFPTPFLATYGPSALTLRETADIADYIRTDPYAVDDVDKAPEGVTGIARLWAEQLGIPDKGHTSARNNALSNASSGRIYNVGFPLITLLTVVSTVILLRRERRSLTTLWTLAMAWSGILLWLASAPGLRFGALYLTIAPALLVADDRIRARGAVPHFPVMVMIATLVALRLSYAGISIRFPFYPAVFLALVTSAHLLQRKPRVGPPGTSLHQVRDSDVGAPGLLAVAGLIAGACLHLPGPGDSFRRHLITPAALGTAPARNATSNDVSYRLVEGECLAVTIPCAQAWNDPTTIGIKLRRPEEGLAGGFERTREATGGSVWRHF